MDREYLKYLKQQFLNAEGSKCKGINYKEFEEYLLQINKLSRKYITYLSNLGIDINDSDIAEVNKGIIESVVYDKSNISLITPFTDGMNTNIGNEIYRFKFVSKDGIPSFVTKTGIIYNMEGIVPSKHSFITQNPYNYGMIEGFSDLSYNGYGVIFGMYGMIYDKDYAAKLKMFEQVKSTIIDCNDEMITEGEDYYLIARSSIKVKTKSR